MTPSPDRATWLRSDRFLARSVAQPVQRFLEVEASGGVLLVVAAAAAILWANSPWSASYDSFWHTELRIELGGHVLADDLRHWVNDGLMTLFFFVIGLEIKHELVNGQLRTARTAVVPITGALGGMAIPAVLYAVINAGGDGSAGWGIPMATDVAFAVGVLALLGRRAPTELKVLLLGLAIVDDIGAVVVIAAFYSDGIDGPWLAVAVGTLAVMALVGRAGVRYLPVFVALGTVVWLATFESGVHATLAGVALGLLTPARPFLPEVDADRIADELSTDTEVTAGEVRSISFRLRESVAPTERLQDLLHPWTSYLVVPVFALANAGVVLDRDTVTEAATSPVATGVAVGLVIGKLTGVTGAILLAARLGIGQLPDGITTRHVLGMAALAGIGFTVSIFVADLAFADELLTAQAKIGVLAASAVAAALGAAILARSGRGRPARSG